VVCIAAGLLAAPVVAYEGLFAFALVASPAVAGEVQGCPSRAFPIQPGSTLHDYAEITVGADSSGMTTGCWATYYEPGGRTTDEVFAFYTDPRNVPGWRLDEAYSNTGFAAFTSLRYPSLEADVEIGALKQFLVAGPTALSYSVSVCLCDPRTMAQ